MTSNFAQAIDKRLAENVKGFVFKRAFVKAFPPFTLWIVAAGDLQFANAVARHRQQPNLEFKQSSDNLVTARRLAQLHPRD